MVERIHVRVMGDQAGVVHEGPERAVPEPRNTTGDSVDTSSHDSKPESPFMNPSRYSFRVSKPSVRVVHVCRINRGDDQQNDALR